MTPRGSLIGAKRRKTSFIKSPAGVVITILLIGTAVYFIWLKDKQESQDNSLALQEKLAAAQNEIQKLRTEITQKNKELQRQKQNPVQSTSGVISIDQLPLQIRGENKSKAEIISKINIICKEIRNVNRLNVGALLAVFREQQKQSVINTALPANNDSRRILYKQIQVVLNAIGSFSGPVTDKQKDAFEAVKNFQRQNKLKVDGKIGLKTFIRIVELFEKNPLDL